MASRTRCICDICLCGKHRCPLKRHGAIIAHSAQGHFLSEYEHNFQAYKDFKRRSLIRPPNKSLDSKARMANKTTASSDFVHHPLSVQEKRPPAKYKVPEGVMDTTSIYKQEYQGLLGERADLLKPQIKVSERKEAMESTTTHSRDYGRKDAPSPQFQKAPNEYRPPSERFNFLTTAKEDFIDHGKVETPNCKPPVAMLKSEDPFDGMTSYQSTFTPPPLPERSVRTPHEYVPPKFGFQATSTSRSDYCEKPLATRETYAGRPDNKFYDDVPFQKTTTSRQSYRKWEIPTRYVRTPEKYVPTDIKLSSETTTKSDFKAYEDARPPSSFKPSNKVSDIAQFDGTTTQSSAFQAWGDVKRPEPISHIKPYEAPSSKFDATSTFQAHYLGATQPRTPSLKPAPTTVKSDVKLESTTSYKLDFSFREREPCPAAFLPSQSSQFKFSHEDEKTGHHHYLSTASVSSN